MTFRNLLFMGWILSEHPADEKMDGWYGVSIAQGLNYDPAPPTCSQTHEWQLRNSDSYQQSTLTDKYIKGHFRADT